MLKSIKKPWFRAKWYGWGWYPATWQGWAVMLVWLLGVVKLFLGIDANSHSASDTLIGFFPGLITLVLLLILVCYLTGEKPHWQWDGKPVSPDHALRQAGVMLIFIVVVEALGVLSGIFTADSVETWYATLIKPSFSPPDIAFPVVWSALYIAMAIAVYIVWYRRKQYQEAKKALWFFVLQLVLNYSWTAIFFGLKSPGLALVWIVLLLAAIITTMIYFWRVSYISFWIMMPYLIWVIFATVLNASIFSLN